VITLLLSATGAPAAVVNLPSGASPFGLPWPFALILVPSAWSTAVGIRRHVGVEPLPVKLIFGRVVTVAIG
jgi:hypothetical protein